MNRELEDLLKAWDAFVGEDVSGSEAKRLYAVCQSKLEEVVARSGSGLSKDLLHRSVMLAYLRWKRANGPKYPTIPARG